MPTSVLLCVRLVKHNDTQIIRKKIMIMVPGEAYFFWEMATAEQSLVVGTVPFFLMYFSRIKKFGSLITIVFLCNET